LAAPAHTQPSPTPTPTPPPGATGQCNDGTYCYSQDRSRACLHHGGVKQWFGSAAGKSNIRPGVDTILLGEGTERAYDLVRQNIALIVDTPADVDAIPDKIGDARSARDQSQVQIALVRQAKDAPARGNLHRMRALLEKSIGARGSGRTAAVEAMPGRGSLSGGDWVMLGLSILVGGGHRRRCGASPTSSAVSRPTPAR